MSIERPESRSSAVYLDIEEKIVTLVIAPGRLVTEQNLCDLSGYGRTPVREAVQKLERDMLVSVMPRRGILIEPIDAQRAIKSLDVRRRLEPFLTERAVRNADDTERWRFGQLAERIEESGAAGDTHAFMALDRELNNRVAQAARHDIACRVVFPLHAISRRIGYLLARETNAGPGNAVDTHSRMARALAAGDTEAALKALDETFETSQSTALRVEEMVNRGQIAFELA
ncbi:GntR family transcriptional regulator [Marinovum sp. 2_MG-2023]|uniref:GntR family transcriptional regulator n=1 Tax=unclassified Marinovum TaxID=2647166 RepID=UPI0026E3E382|nr:MULTISPECIES: GntR family transcriptional regulator [unclassified Marinovum]MDO6730783.1 GntR family transcriptional regulator [Marinovum sp. 2_MG-2023]MDO6780012.1 GntR family transcriptional regulator [Marinovum sp. 1_MG-2023]